jgi:hypothetical protein
MHESRVCAVSARTSCRDPRWVALSPLRSDEDLPSRGRCDRLCHGAGSAPHRLPGETHVGSSRSHRRELMKPAQADAISTATPVSARVVSARTSRSGRDRLRQIDGSAARRWCGCDPRWVALSPLRGDEHSHRAVDVPALPGRRSSSAPLARGATHVGSRSHRWKAMSPGRRYLDGDASLGTCREPSWPKHSAAAIETLDDHARSLRRHPTVAAAAPHTILGASKGSAIRGGGPPDHGTIRGGGGRNDGAFGAALRAAGANAPRDGRAAPRAPRYAPTTRR